MSRVYVGNLDPRVTERELEDEFRIFGVLRSVWVARRPPGYAFVEFDDRRDAIDAIRELDARTVGVSNFLIIRKVAEAVVGIVVGTVVGVRIRSVMSVVNLVTLLVNAACALAHEAREVGDVEAPALIVVRVQLMDLGAGAIVHVGEDLLGATAYHLIVVAATAGHLHIVILVVIHLMLMEIKVGLELKQI